MTFSYINKNEQKGNIITINYLLNSLSNSNQLYMALYRPVIYGKRSIILNPVFYGKRQILNSVF